MKKIVFLLLCLASFMVRGQNNLTDINVIFNHSFVDNTLGAYNTTELYADWNNPPSNVLNTSRSFIAVDTIAGTRTKVLHWEYPKGSLSPTYGGGQWETAVGASYSEIYFSYDIRFKPGFNFLRGGKIPGLKGGPDFDEYPLPDEGFTASMMFTKGGKINFYSYNQAGASQSYSWGTSAFVPGQWHNITYRVVMNTVVGESGNQDGILEGFFDGQLVVTKSDIKFRNLSSIGVDCMKIYTFFGGATDDWRNTKDEWVNLDNFILYTFKTGVSVPRGQELSPSGRTIPFFGRMQNADDVVTENTQYSLAVQKTGNGTVFPVPGTYTYGTTSLPNLVAIPDFGWQFDGWSDGVVPPNTDLTYKRPFSDVTSVNDNTFALMTSNKTVTATFSQAPSQANLPSTIAQINFTDGYSHIQSGWINVRGDYPYPVYLGYGITMKKEGTIFSLDDLGEPSTIYPANVGTYYNWLQTTDTEPVVFTLTGLDPSRTFSFDFFSSRDATGTRTTYFTIGSTTKSINACSNTGTLVTFEDVSPSSEGEIVITMSKNSGGYGYINAMIVRKGSAPNPIGYPTGLQSTSVTSSSVGLSWTDNSTNETNFSIERSLMRGSGYTVVGTVGQNVTAFTNNTGLTANTTYFYRVRATNASGNSAYSNVLQVITTSATTPTVTISATDASAAEQNQDTGTFTVSRGTATSGNLTVNYTIGGTASSGDYTQTLTGSVTITNGNSTATITITPVDDSADEDDPETVILTLSSGTGYTVGALSSATVNIADNDGTEETIAMINFTASGSAESGWTSVYGSASSPVNLGSGLTLTISGNTLSTGVNGEPITIFPTNVGGRYNFLSSSVNTTTLLRISGLNPSETYSFDFFESRDDASASGDRTATFTIGGTSVGVNPIGNTDNLLTISNVSPNSSGIVDVTMSKISGQYGYINAMIIRTSVEPDPEVSISATDASAAEQGQDTGTFTVSRGTATSGNLTVNYTVGGTASSGDYTQTLTGSVTIADGNSTATITITPVDDSTDEDDPETVILTLASGTGYTVGTPSSATVNIADNDNSATLVKTVKVNMFYTGYAGGSGWNDFTSQSAGSSLSLNDDLGNSSGYTIYNEDVWTGSNANGMSAGPYPTNVNRAAWYNTTGMTNDIEFRNLNNSHYYYLEFYGSRATTGQTRKMRITIGSEYDICDIDDNTTDKAIFTNVVPSSGTIRASMTVETGSYGYLNAIVLQEYDGLKSAKISTSSSSISDKDAPFVYPNPFNDVLQIGNTKNISRAEIIDISGKTIIVKQNAKSSDMKIDTQTLKRGMYVLRLLDGAEVISVHKIVK
ncbi:MAG: hypothetical protein A2W90_13490 [Bacteroidetes bacterium GWF2_42_66]|nr:MAG: hypothetical protein A2W92_14205 [Bacteroidetes bacterium GWA2_42_15]OFX97277.1 MAG: hypothetical protein A2W89_00665 [Bacteroidetes bacterium GWE2_42_39]OFY39914.1 MAG: hypothetical protein A2W90_13490 [Bacteroidetes bacterium GWF2_42_66]HBL78095.1 hypothetical protein [Prolixibacteraceae bacterium]HCR90380.1 hypothetical protein [Prolixibacteraceae bacterium]